MEKSKANY